MTCLGTVLGPPNRAGAMADGKQVAAKHQQSLQFVSEGCCSFDNNLHWVAWVAECTNFLDVLIILRFSLHFVPSELCKWHTVFRHIVESREGLSISVAWVATVQVKSSWKRSRGRCWAFWLPDEVLRPDAKFVKSQEALTDVHFSCKEAAILLYQMSYGAATPHPDI